MRKSTIILAVILMVCAIMLIGIIGLTLYFNNEKFDNGWPDANESADATDAIDGNNECAEDLTQPSEALCEIRYALGDIIVYADCNAENQIGIIGARLEVQCIADIDDVWTQIVYGGEDAYVLSDYLTDTPVQDAVPLNTEPRDFEDEYGNVYQGVNEEVRATGNVYIRSGPSMEFDKLAVLGEGGRITRIGIGKNGWSKVVYYDKEAYVTSYYLTPTLAATYIETDETVYAIKTSNIRTGPTIQNPILGVLEKDAAITRVGIGSDGWSKVIYKGETAYMYSLYLASEDGEHATEEEISNAEDGACTMGQEEVESLDEH